MKTRLGTDSARLFAEKCRYEHRAYKLKLTSGKEREIMEAARGRVQGRDNHDEAESKAEDVPLRISVGGKREEFMSDCIP